MLQNKRFKWLIKTTLGLSLFCWMTYSLVHQIRHQPNLSSTIDHLFSNFGTIGIIHLLLVLLFMMVNWALEAVKWKLLLKGTEQFGFGRALQSVLTGVAVSMITPNRIGEYVGRILYLRNVHKLQGVTVTIIGSFAQLIVTSFFGLIGLSYYLLNIKQSKWLFFLLILSLLLSGLLGYIYFHLSTIYKWTQNRHQFRKMSIYLEIIRRFDKKQLVQILFVSCMRYFVYSFQFMILLHLFMVEANQLDILFTIWLIFWAMAIVPTIAIAEIGIRGETALFFLLPISINQFGIVSSTVLLWVINLIIPALVGCLFVYRIKIYDDE